MTNSSVFTVDEWTLVKRAPFLAFYFVANADNNIEPHEVERLIQQLETPERYKSDLFALVITEIMSNAKELAITVGGIIAEQDQDLRTQIQAIAKALDTKLDPGEAQAFKNAVAMLGMDIAAATGDTELPVSKEEWSELQRFKNLLGA